LISFFRISFFKKNVENRKKRNILKFHFRDISGFLSKKKGFFEVRFFGLISYSSSRSNAPAMGRSRDKDFFFNYFCTTN